MKLLRLVLRSMSLFCYLSPNKALQPTAIPLRRLSSAELWRWAPDAEARKVRDKRRYGNNMTRDIDTTLDFRADTPPGKDPDAHSPKLRRYHKLLWSKPLPGGSQFDLVDTTPRVYLHHRSQVGEFWLSSDTVIPCFIREPKIKHITEQIPANQLAWFNTIGYTMGGMMVFPANRIERKNTINGARGFHPRIKDRFDLTVECIRRYYIDEPSPLSDVFQRYSDFFSLFVDFRGYVDFFLLQDIVNNDCSEVNTLLPFKGFETSPLPDSKDSYLSYMAAAIDFIEARNYRIQSFWQTKETH